MESEKVKEIKNWLYERSDGKLLDNSYNLVGITYGDILTLINELEKENAKLLDSVETVQSNRCVYKCVLTKEHLTKFAERLKENITVWYPSVIESIDETLKECL